MIARSTHQKFTLTARKREEIDTPKSIRKSGGLPAILYGKEATNVPLAISLDDFGKLFKEAGESTIIDLAIEGEDEPRPVLIKDIQFDPTTDGYLHVDLYQIRAGEKLRVTVPLRFEGEAPAVEDFGGILVTNKDEIEIECLPKDLPHDIEVDISVLKEIDDSITIKDLRIPAGIEMLDEPDESVMVVAPPAVEEEEVAPVSEAEAVAAVEATEEKREEAPGEESANAKPTEQKEE
ncbi:hypothetical protein A2V68_00435 [candidate division Kazan bacterium RBG_13_50_9]|uniref:Large ribosomal subunit protein bL25 n=1 Tax=candidate division Kazan bacterium RBG_13_50_9 TaxID=1798535 RepID=A0A1F4NRW1_UNCK3|nr:MAG: hypothetical protein A2V68_00435 [candidate division Kazan bacterium RBG_13_50_9]